MGARWARRHHLSVLAHGRFHQRMDLVLHGRHGVLLRRGDHSRVHRSRQQERQPALEPDAHAGWVVPAAPAGHPERIRGLFEASGHGDLQHAGVGGVRRGTDSNGGRQFPDPDGGNRRRRPLHHIQGRRCRLRHPPGLARGWRASEPDIGHNEPLPCRLGQGLPLRPAGRGAHRATVHTGRLRPARDPAEPATVHCRCLRDEDHRERYRA